jgi:hypothetical protein
MQRRALCVPDWHKSQRAYAMDRWMHGTTSGSQSGAVWNSCNLALRPSPLSPIGILLKADDTHTYTPQGPWALGCGRPARHGMARTGFCRMTPQQHQHEENIRVPCGGKRSPDSESVCRDLFTSGLDSHLVGSTKMRLRGSGWVPFGIRAFSQSVAPPIPPFLPLGSY